MKDWKTEIIIIAIVIIAVATMMAIASSWDSQETVNYDRLNIDGMPCVYVSRGSAALGSARGGLSCNWDMWDGSKHGEYYGPGK